MYKSLPFFFLLIIATFWANAQSPTYQYDSKNQLQQADWGNGTTIQYNHDAVGNRINTIVTVVSPTFPDLVVQSPGLNTTSVVPAGSLVANAISANTGTGNAGGHNLRLYLSANITYEQANDSMLAVRSINGLLAGANSSQSNINITIPAGTTPGTWYILFYTDANTSVTESNENNNIAYVQITVINCNAMVLTTGNTAATCGQSNGTATASVTGGSGNYSYLWNTIPSQTTANATALSAGTYSVTATDNTTGCIKSANVQVGSSGSLPSASFTYSVAGNTVQFTNTSQGGVSYSWNYGDGNTATTTSPNYTYATAGTYYVCLTTTNTCGSDQYCVNVITIGSQPCNLQVTITASATQVCTGSSVTLSVPASFVSYNWSTGAQTNQISVNTPGTYSITVTDAAGCTASNSVTIISAGSAPSASFASSTLGQVVTLTNTSQNATSYSWDFGDGNYSTTTSPVHTYTADGTYTVCLNAQNGCGAANYCATVQIGSIIPTEVSVSGDSITITYPAILGTITNLTNASVKIIGEATGYKSGILTQQGNVLTFVCNSAINPGEVLHIIILNGMVDSNGNTLGAFSKILYAPAGAPSCAVFDTLSTGLKFPNALYSYNIDAADFDRNGQIDIVCRYHASYGAATNLVIYLRNPNGTFQSPQNYSNSSSHSALAGTPDLNNDGYPDIVVTHNVPSSIAVWMNNGNGTFAASPATYTLSNYSNGVRFADVNNDGYIDIIGYSGISGLASNRISILLNNGNGTFAAQVTYTNSSTFGSGLVALDLNKDGWQDFAYTSNTAFGSAPTFQLFTNNGTGVITNTLNQANSDLLHAIGAADLNADGNDDILLTGPNYSQIKFGDGLGNFPTSLNIDSFYTFSTHIGDINGDGLFDMVVKNRYDGSAWGTSPYVLHKNNGNGTFQKIYGTVAYAKGLSPKTHDITNDGALDYVYIGLNDSIYFAVNRTNPTISISASVNSICPGQGTTINAGQGFVSYNWSNGNNTNSFTTTQAGLFSLIATDASGCIAANDILISALDTALTQLSATICSGDSYLGYTQSNTYTDVFTGLNGCDSTRVLYLTVLQPINNSVSQTICYGETYEGYNATGQYVNTFTATNGCDSIRTLNLTILPELINTVTETICLGDNYEGYNSTGTYTDVFTAVNNCDSTRILELTVIALTPPVITEQNGILSSSYPTGNQWYFNGNIIPLATGQYYSPTADGNYTVEYTDINGCSSGMSATYPFTITDIEHTIISTINIYPNPTTGNFTISGETSTTENIEIKFYNLLNQLIYSKQVIGINGKFNIEVNPGNIAQGVYMLQLSNGKINYTEKVVIQK